MKLPKLFTGTLVKRYKRFLADVVTASGETITVHCPNTGAMTGCIDPESRVYYSESDNLKRKYPCTLEFVETPAGLVSVNTGRANTLVGEALAHGRIQPLTEYLDIKAEAKIPDGGGRFDFLARDPAGNAAYIEVKSVTLLQAGGRGEFPDAVSARAETCGGPAADGGFRASRCFDLLCPTLWDQVRQSCPGDRSELRPRSGGSRSRRSRGLCFELQNRPRNHGH